MQLGEACFHASINLLDYNVVQKIKAMEENI